jgi:hypothetical protein
MPRKSPVTAPQPGHPLGELMPPREYIRIRQHVFPSEGSFDWFCRRNKDLVLRNGALAMPLGVKLVNAERMDATVREVGAARAAAEAA